MSSRGGITLQLTPERLKALCLQIGQRATRAEQGMTALMTLQSILATLSDPAQQASESYRQLQSLLTQHSEQMRQRVLTESANRLVQALQARDSNAIAAIYAPLSRSGFAASLEQAINRLSDTDLSLLSQWIRQWHATTKARGEAASGCPDAIDFAAARIDVLEFNAITDILRHIETRVP